MNFSHKIKVINGEEVFILYCQFHEEFSKEFLHSNQTNHGLYHQIMNYLRKTAINFHGKKIILVVNGLMIGSLLFQNPILPQLKVNSSEHFLSMQYIPSLTLNTPEITLDKPESEEIINPPQVEENTTEKQPQSNTNSSNKPPTNSNKPNTSPSQNNSNPSNNSSSIPKPTVPPVEETPEKETGITIRLKRNGKIQEILLEDYIIGVVGSEMPASFSMEALKAQAVAARTYALKKMQSQGFITDTDSHQVYKDSNQLKQIWGSSFATYYQKIETAVNATKGKVLTYNGNYIDAVYHSTSNGKTQDAVSVWGNHVPYLISVDSPWDFQASSYLRTITMDQSIILNTFGILKNDLEIVERDKTGRVKLIKVGDNHYSGHQFRTMLGLRSSDFDLSIEGNSVTITTRGYGHGVGMSQYGANGMAKEGYSYDKILSHYYPGTILITK